MRTALYTVALSAALLLTASNRIGSSGGPGLHSRSQVHVRGYCARRGTHSCMHPGAHERAVRGLLIKAVEGRHGSSRSAKGTSSTSAPRPRMATLPTA